MADIYPFKTIETKWQHIWKSSKLYHSREKKGQKKYYLLEMLPYPSGRLHMGHVRNYSIGDAVARYKRMNGFNVIHPIGWDAFGLPAENAAIKNYIHPEKWTLDNISFMKSQMKQLGFSYDWEREVATCLPEYYKWNQWFFLKMYEKDMIYRKMASVNWCNSCRTVLANEQVINGRCWRDDTMVVQKQLSQWYIKLTDYAEELLQDIQTLDQWPERVKVAQTIWIGKSTGANLYFDVAGSRMQIEVFTTRIDTIFGTNCIILSPGHPLVDELISDHAEKSKIRDFLDRMITKSSTDRSYKETTKEGIFLGKYAINPFNEEKIPIWSANFILMEYGTGAIMAVPGHDVRDYEFSLKYHLPIQPVIVPSDEKPRDIEGVEDEPIFTGYGRLVNSGPWSGLSSEAAMQQMADYAGEQGFGNHAVSYRIRDWGISRQRYWGTPIPIVYCDECGIVPLPYDLLPVLLPPMERIDYHGGSPLNNIEEFVNTHCPKCGGEARRETDTMDTFVDSSWYYLRYTDARIETAPVDTDKITYWFPVDFYIGGIEHATGHLIYTRFWWKMMRDLGLVDGNEPVQRLLTQGMVIKDGAKMSKSLGNTVDPDTITEEFGADTTRLFILFASPPEKDLDWSGTDIKGCFRFLNRFYRIVSRHLSWMKIPSENDVDADNLSPNQMRLLRKVHQTIHKVSTDIEERLHFNTAIAACMELLNEMHRLEKTGIHEENDRRVFKQATENLILLLSPFVPHITEELWSLTGHGTSTLLTPWPKTDEKYRTEDKKSVEIPVMVNGKLRSRIDVPVDIDESRAKEQALALPKIQKILEDKELKKTIFIAGKVINLIVK